MRKRFVFLACALVVLSACSSHGQSAADKAPKETVLGRAAAVTMRAESAQLASTADASDAPVRASGLVDFRGDRAQLIEETQDGTQAIFDGDTAYVSILLREGNPTPWQRFVRTSERLFATRPDVVDPARMLDLLGAAESPTVIGVEPVGQDSAKHYRSTIDLNKALKGAKDGRSREFRAGEIGAGMSSVGLDAWIDDAGRARRIVAVWTPSNSATTSSSAAPSSPARPRTTTLELSAFGTAAIVQPPSQDRVSESPSPAGG